VTAAYHLDAWGNYRFTAELAPSHNRLGFTGHYWDNEAGLYYAKARYYDPFTARFTQSDSFLGNIDDPPSLHRYFYAADNPTRYVDPTGHAAEDDREQRKLYGGRNATISADSSASAARGAFYYSAETALEFASPIPLGLSDLDTSIHPLMPNSQSGSWWTGANQMSSDYAAFKGKYGREAQVAEGAAVMKYGGKAGKVMGAVTIIGAIVFGGKPGEITGVQEEKPKEYRGGPHEETRLPKGDELDSHHMPAKAASPLDPAKGPAIQMERTDHWETSSHPRQGLASVEYRAKIKELVDKGEWRKALAIEIKDVRRIGGTKYNEAIKQMLEYARTLEETGFLKKPPKK
ncbi:MAG: RHS repeat-associated core domain-containing protein, partial [Vicinamibacteria bacterium]